MELMFNELSVKPLSNSKYEGIEKVIEFAKTMANAHKNGFQRIRSHQSNSEILLSKDYTLQDYLYDKNLPSIHRTYKDLLFGTVITPFINEEDEEVVDAYIQSDFIFDDTETKQECLGLTAAHFYETLSISLNSSELWQTNTLSIIKAEVEVEEVNNVFSKDCFEVQSISDFVENLGELDLQETEIKPSDKSITLFGDHHGKADLQVLANKLVKSHYVVEIRSTDFGGNSFIRKIYDNGVLEVVVMKRDERFALWVQTTGRNYRETEAIAKNLKERYS